MARKARKYKSASFFHTIVQGIDKEDIFKNERYKNEYKKLLDRELIKTNIILETYCIMDNHAHMILKVDKIENLSALMKKINSAYAAYYNYMENGRVGYVFKDRFLSEPITNKKYLINCIKYIHNNPVKARITRHCAAYKFSSYNDFLKVLNTGKGEILKILDRAEILDICYNTSINIVCLDIDNSRQEIVLSGITNFLEKEQIDLYKIFETRNTLINLIKHLKNIEKVKYVEIMKELEINKSTMESILQQIRKTKKINILE